MHEQLSLPNILFVGPMKCGTSWIQNYLEHHESVELPNGVKETFFFDRHFDRGASWYARFFNQKNPGPANCRAEVAPSLFHAPDEVLQGIKQTLKDPVIIITLRDPVSRCWSHYQHMRRGYTQKPLIKAIEEFPEILSASQYEKHILRWRQQFSRVHILLQEDLHNDPVTFSQNLCEIMGIEYQEQDNLNQRVNIATEPRSFWVAKIGRYTARFLRFMGLYGLVNRAKALGLKRLFYGNESKKNPSRLLPDEQEQKYLENALQEDIGKYRQSGY